MAENSLVPPAKRGVDLVMACLMLLFCGPLLLAGLAISALFTRSNPIFRQRRVGLNRALFNTLKIRTMYVHGSHSTVTVLEDPRVVPTLRWMRHTKFDELPQLLNVLKGEMSIVGPRPMVPEDATRVPAWAEPRFSVRPGMTGLAQVQGNTRLTWEERLEFDRAYVERWSVGLELAILVGTLSAVRSGADDVPPGSGEWRDDGA